MLKNFEKLQNPSRQNNRNTNNNNNDCTNFSSNNKFNIENINNIDNIDDKDDDLIIKQKTYEHAINQVPDIILLNSPFSNTLNTTTQIINNRINIQISPKRKKSKSNDFTLKY